MKKLSNFVDRFEENCISILLGLMVLITFTQVIARYLFNTGWGSALQVTQVLFAWMIMLGMSYGIRIGSHLGVDILIRKFSTPVFRFYALFGAFACIVYGVTFLSADWIALVGGQPNKGGAYTYWLKMYQIGIGMDDIILPEFLFGPDLRLPRWIAYIMLPVGLCLFIFRSVQAFFAILFGKREMIIASHEAEELLEKNKNVVGD